MNSSRYAFLQFTLLLVFGAQIKQVSAEPVVYKDIVYKTVSGKQLALDIYLPDHSEKEFSLLIWAHGGAWMRGSKGDFPESNPNLAGRLLEEGYALASVAYRLSQESQFPAQVQDVNDAIQYLYDNSHRYNLNKERIGIMGRSAGGHLASLVAVSNGCDVEGFSSSEEKYLFDIKVAVDLFGPSDFIALRGNSGRIDHDDPNTAEAKLLGYPPLERPDIAKWASPTTYVTKNSPPFIILHGGSDPIVPASQSILFNAYLNLAGVPSELIIIDEARHGDPVFDSKNNVTRILAFLHEHFPVTPR